MAGRQTPHRHFARLDEIDRFASPESKDIFGLPDLEQHPGCRMLSASASSQATLGRQSDDDERLAFGLRRFAADEIDEPREDAA